MNQIIIGYGEIGKAIHALVTEAWIIDPAQEHDKPNPIIEVDVMHICFPFSVEFAKDMRNYIDAYNPKHVIIYSTLPIGTTKEISLKIIHSPVEGKHPDLHISVRVMERWLGYNDKEEVFFFVKFFEDLGLRVKPVENTDFTEALKLLSTSEYGINIEFARYKKKVADAIGMDFELTKRWNEDYNELYEVLGMSDKYKKFVLDAPEGSKGGHCVVPNARLLHQQFPDEITKIVGELNDNF